jgi:zinc transport system substrate-binding protein
MKHTIAKILCVTLLLTVACSGISLAFWDSKPSIVTTTFPLYDFTRNVVGDRAELTLLIPPGAEAHSWEPTPSAMVKIQKSKLFIYNGAGLEAWAEKLENTVLAGKKMLEASSVVSLLTSEDEIHEHTREQSHAHGHNHGETDPHIWLDPVNAQAIVAAIAQAVTEADPVNAAYYAANAEAYINQLRVLDAEYRAVLSPVAGREFVTTHAAFAYLAKRYNLRQSAIMGIDPEAEPTPESLATIIKHIKANNIQYIFAEPVLSSKLAATIAGETGARVLVLNPVHEVTEEQVNQGENYITFMRNNLESLKIAFGM